MLHRSMDHLSHTKLDELCSKIGDLKEAQHKLNSVISEPPQPPPSTRVVEDMIRDMNETHQETQQQIRRIAGSISSLETAVTRLTGGTTYSVGASAAPTLEDLIKADDGNGAVNNRGPGRRRTGPLSREQRVRAAMIRKLGACQDCRRRRVAVGSPEFYVPPMLVG